MPIRLRLFDVLCSSLLPISSTLVDISVFALVFSLIVAQVSYCTRPLKTMVFPDGQGSYKSVESCSRESWQPRGVDSTSRHLQPPLRASIAGGRNQNTNLISCSAPVASPQPRPVANWTKLNSSILFAKKNLAENPGTDKFCLPQTLALHLYWACFLQLLYWQTRTCQVTVCM